MIEELPQDLEDRCSIFMMANAVAFTRMKDAIGRLEKSEPSPLLNCLFGESENSGIGRVNLDEHADLEFFDESLNDSQKNAIRFSLSSPLISLIHGPPGTGKTHTCVELIQQLAKRKERILVCGGSNISVDNLVERLAKKPGLNIVRLGHPARVLSSVLDHSLEVRSRSCDEGQIVNEVRADLDRALKALSKCKKGDKRTYYTEIKALRQEVRSRETKVVDQILNGANVVLCLLFFFLIILGTLNGAASRTLYQLFKSRGEFDTALIDESSQAV
jgi:DNA polymerase alpha-associated DNA helicase A